QSPQCERVGGAGRRADAGSLRRIGETRQGSRLLRGHAFALGGQVPQGSPMTFAFVKRIAIAMVILVLGMAAAKGAPSARSIAGAATAAAGAAGQEGSPVRTVPSGTRIAG